MKNVIIICSLIFILLFFPLQSMKDVTTDVYLKKMDMIVEKACELAKQEGYFTTTIVTNMKSEMITAYPDLNSTEIIVAVTSTKKYRLNYVDEREFIYYDISVPIKHVVAMADFFGIPDSENTIYHHKKGYVLSEVNIT